MGILSNWREARDIQNLAENHYLDNPQMFPTPKSVHEMHAQRREETVGMVRSGEIDQATADRLHREDRHYANGLLKAQQRRPYAEIRGDDLLGMTRDKKGNRVGLWDDED